MPRAKAILAGRPGQRTTPRNVRRPGGAAWRALAAIGSDGVMVLDAEGRIVEANRRAAEWFGIREGELAGRLAGELLALLDPAAPRKAWWSTVGTEPVRLEGHVVAPSGQARSCHATAQAMPGAKVLLVLGIAEDREARLRDVSQHLSVAASKAPLIIWAVDREMRFTTAQGSGLAALGITDPSEMLGHSARDVFPDLPEAIAYCERALAGESLHLRFSARGATLENWYIPMRSLQGAVLGVQGVALDVTERVRADLESARTLQNLDEAQRLAVVGSWDEDLATGVSRWSPQLYRILGFDPETFVPTRQALLDAISAQDRRGFEATIARLLREGGSAEQTLRARRTAGGAGRILQVRALASQAAPGSAPRFFGTVQDITERDRARREMRRAKESLADAQRVAGIGSWEWDRGSGEVRGSEELHRMLGVEPQADLVEAVQARLHPDDRDQILAAVRTVLDGGHPPLALFRIVHPSHGVRWLEHRTAQRGDLPLVGTVQDVTAREIARLQLRRADERLREAQRVAQIGNWEWTPVLGIGFWSEELYRLLGIAPGEAPPTPATLLGAIEEADRASFRNAIEEALSERAPAPVYGRVRAGGESRHVRFLAKLVSHGSEPDLLVGTLQDVTGWRRAEERMSVLSSALEQTADAAYVTDRAGALLYVNEAFLAQTGYGREELLGQNLRLLESGAHPPEFYDEFWRHILGGKVWRGTFINRRKDGTLYHEEKAVTPIRSEDGQVTHFVATGRDITERMGVEEAQARVRQVIARSAREWRATFDAVDSPILVLDSEAKIMRPNRAARDLAGAPYASLVGAPVQDLGTGALWRAMAEAAKLVRGEGRPASLQVQDPETGTTWDVSASPLMEPDIGEGVVIVLGRDVSPVVRLQESLRRMETISAMGRLVAGVAHEVRNPLFAISATLDALDAERTADPGRLRYGDMLRAEVRRLTDLMHDLLEYGRPTSPQLEPGSLGPIVERACKASAPIIRERRVRVEQDVPDDLPQVAVDEGRFCQVIQNLVENAAQHSPVGSVVQIRAQAIPGARVEIQVADTGPGFNPEDIAHLFEPFYSRRRGGTGLGLSIVQRIVMEHGGEVQVSNHSAGGASVLVRVPVAPRSS